MIFIYFIYGLAFFVMGVVVVLEGGRASDLRLRRALRPLAAFGLVHGLHEWLEMFERLSLLPMQTSALLGWEALRLGLLAFSFLSLSAFGTSLLAPQSSYHRLGLLAPLLQVAAWGLGLFLLRGQLTFENGLWEAAHVWSRYVLAIPAALLASAGLVVQQRVFRWAGLVRFGRDSLWAAVAFAWYGLVGQLFTEPSRIPPSSFLNDQLFLQVFGFPVQILRALAAMLAAVFVIRTLRAFEVETQRQIAELQRARVEEAERREALRGDLLRRVVAAQEAERQRIARELHDATGQSLTALGLGLRGAAGSMRLDTDRAGRELRQLEDLVGTTLNELRHVIADLRPPHLDDLGLAAAIRWYGKQVAARAGLELQIEADGAERPASGPLNIALFRITQEALNNIVKHSGARHAWVRLYYDDRTVALAVEDDGCGFDTAARAAGDRPAWGLLGMQERAALLGGRCSVASQPGRGTRVDVEIPLSNGSDGHANPTAAGG